jgi:hypothetical protein
MFDSLPQLVRLQNLKLYGFGQAVVDCPPVDRERVMEGFLKSMRQNGSVRTLSLYWSAKYSERDPKYEEYGNKTTNLLAYVARNAKVPQLLATTMDFLGFVPWWKWQR